MVNDFRILDILQKADTEGTLSVTPDQFAEALEVIQLYFLQRFSVQYPSTEFRGKTLNSYNFNAEEQN